MSVMTQALDVAQKANDEFDSAKKSGPVGHDTTDELAEKAKLAWSQEIELKGKLYYPRSQEAITNPVPLEELGAAS